MDPTECLARIREQVTRVFELGTDNHAFTAEMADAAQELAMSVNDLDEWLAKGGFVPNQWKPRPPAAPRTGA